MTDQHQQDIITRIHSGPMTADLVGIFKGEKI
jgi:hypothetical protein